MWLIDCTSSNYELVFHHRPPFHKYLILSHTWGDEEVSFQDIRSPDLESVKTMRGFDKIRRACQLARLWNYRYAWVDTCCIDKTSSAELGEAINSMFHWYGGSDVCVAFLEDLEPGTGPLTEKDLRPCRWFTRGWTLQELLAPRWVRFFDKNWKFRGEKQELLGMLSAVTGVDEYALEGPLGGMPGLSVARRMSWAARRQTTRPEDLAYCLMGMFEVNMPLLYGEGGTNAFIRLQEAILQRGSDLSLFAWNSSMPSTRSMFAASPADFSNCSTVEQCEDAAIPQPLIVLGNLGIQLTTSLARLSSAGDPKGEYSKYGFWHLGCRKKGKSSDPHQVLVLPLLPDELGYAKPWGLFARTVDQRHLRFVEPTLICIAKTCTTGHGPLSGKLSLNSSRSLGYASIFGYPSHLWSSHHMAFPIQQTTGYVMEDIFNAQTKLESFLGAIRVSFPDASLHFWVLTGDFHKTGTEAVPNRQPWVYVSQPLHRLEGSSVFTLGEEMWTHKELENPFNISTLRMQLQRMMDDEGWYPPEPSVQTLQHPDLGGAGVVVVTAWASRAHHEITAWEVHVRVERQGKTAPGSSSTSSSSSSLLQGVKGLQKLITPSDVRRHNFSTGREARPMQHGRDNNK